jgi:nicotinamidase-related amidase/alkylated DNA repair dioxygenase AlkB/glutathione S-transferase
MNPNMANLMDLVSQNQPHFQTNQALLVIGLQNDFLLPDGRIPVDTKNGFLERIQTLIPKFRVLSGNVIWVQTLYEADRIAIGADTGEGDALVMGGLIDGDESATEAGEEELGKEAAALPAQSRSSKHKQRALAMLKRVAARRKALPKEVARAAVEEDEELFLLKSDNRTPACVPGTGGAEFADVIARQFELPTDIVIKTTNYSAFQGTNLLMTLRAKLVTELFICGCITNVSVLATVIDAARHGIKICVIEDCLGFRKENRHDLAVKRMEEFFSAYLVNSVEILARDAPETLKKPSTILNGARASPKTSEIIEAAMGKMTLGEDGRPVSRGSNPRSPTRILSGKQRTLSLVSAAESRKSAQNPSPLAEELANLRGAEPTDKRFADILEKGATVPKVEEEEKPQLVKTKIRMRTGNKKKKKSKTKGEEEKEGGELASANGVPNTPANQSTTKTTPPTTTTPTVKPPQTPTEAQRISLIAKAGNVSDLRDEESKECQLKNAASVPVFSSNVGSEEKERNRFSDLSDRVRMSLTRAPKSETGSDSKRDSIASTKAASIASKQEDKATKQGSVNSSNTITTPQLEQTLVKAAVPDTAVPSTPAKSATLGKPSKLQSLANLPVLGPGDHIAEDDTRIINDFFPPDLRHPSDTSKPLKDVIFRQLYNEVRWQKMLHQQGEVPRLVCCQGAFEEDGSMPVYRHPADQTLPLLHFSPKVQLIRKQAEKLVGHPLNHVLIQLYRSGNDFISEHSDKTLDIVKNSSIINISFGSQRTMRLRSKKSQTTPEDTAPQRSTQRVSLPHNSMFVLGLATNKKWLHGIQPDKRTVSERSPSELAYNGIRISLTFRHIGTFLDAKESLIWGQGASAKQQRDAADVINGDEEETKRMITAFSRENHYPGFEWEEWYGEGFDVLHLHGPSEDLPLLFASNNGVETRQVQIMLAEAKINYKLVEAPTLETAFEVDRQVAFRDNDTHHTEVVRSSSILLYLDRHHPLDTSDVSKSVMAMVYPTFLLSAGIKKAWNNRLVVGYLEELKNLVALLEEQITMEGGPWIAGRRFSVGDCFAWPVVDELVGEWEGWSEEGYPGLSEWHRGCWRKKASVKKVKEKLLEPKVRAEAETEEKA